MKIVLFNAGSSSLKATLVETQGGRTLARGQADWASGAAHYEYQVGDAAPRRENVALAGHADAVRKFVFDLEQTQPVALADRSELTAVGHRIVHGGPFTSSARITPAVREQIAALVELAPLHNPPSLAALAAAEAELPAAAHVAVFDTAFHATLAPEAYTYPIPARWTHEWGIRRYGFHGLSYAYCSRRAAEMLGRPEADLKLVICHLGHGCSAAAVRGGRSVDTTMGYTPLEGLMMATRSGSLDPSIALLAQERGQLSVGEVEQILNRQSGLLGVSGVSADLREVLAAAHAGTAAAQLAIDIYTHRARQAIGALTVTLGGVDALVFTAGVGEHAAEIRAAICEGLDCLGLAIDAAVNTRCQPDADIARADSRGRILVIATREDATMLAEVSRVLGSPP